jgi:thymidylate synthase (FAD)
MRNRHGSPFEHNLFTFVVECPIFVAREWFRHRWSSFNEVSGRYSVLPDKSWTPALDAVRHQVGKPGAYEFDTADAALADAATSIIAKAHSDSRMAYRSLLDLGIAKEVARAVLPLGQSTRFFWSVNARSLMNFLSLRNEPSAQREIRSFAEAIEGMASECMPHTFAAFVAAGRLAP